MQSVHDLPVNQSVTFNLQLVTFHQLRRHFEGDPGN